MKGLSVHLLLLCLQIYLASKLARGSSSIGKRSNAGHLIKTKSGKTFLQLSGKKTRITKDTRKESGNDYSNCCSQEKEERKVEPRSRLHSKMISQKQQLKRSQRQKLAKLKSRCDSLVNLDSIVVPLFTNTVRE